MELVSQSRPITCISVTEKLIFVCEGSGLIVFSKITDERLVEKVIFPQHKTILGISIWKDNDSSQYCIFAFGRNYSQLYIFNEPRKDIQPIIIGTNPNDSTCDNVELLNKHLHTYIAAKWLDNGQKLAAVTDENILHIWDWGQKLVNVLRRDYQAINVNFSTIRGIQTSLFSATLSGSREEDLIVFSGTNLSSVFVWAPQDRQSCYHILLEGIKGSVLSLKFCEKNQILAASSDERSVFAWRFTSTDNNFGPQIFINKSVQVHLVAEMTGHTGRVWDVDINHNFIASAGQDSNTILWNLKGKLLKVWSGSNSINLRCCVIDSWNNSILSGGDDGSVTKWNFSVNTNWEKSIEFTNSTDIMDLKNEDYARKVICYDSNNFICPTNLGQFLLVDTKGNKSRFFSNDDLSSYSICSLSKNKDEFIIGSKLGLVCFVKLKVSNSPRKEEEGIETGMQLDGECYQKIQLDSKIRSIHWISSNKIVGSTCTAFYILTKKVSLDKSNSNEWIQTSQFVINWKDKPGLTAVIELNICTNYTVCNNQHDDDYKREIVPFLIVGDEWGGLHVFNYEQETKYPLFSLSKVHGIYGALDLKKCINEGEIWSIGRNKSILNLKLELLEKDTLNPRLFIIQDINSCLSWNSKFINSKTGSYICGFSENDFVIIDKTNDKIAKKYPCGGAHRSWDVDFNNGIITFAFIRLKNLCIARFALDAETIKAGFYGGRTINVVETFTLDSFKILCILTGGEDGIIRLTIMNQETDTTCSNPSSFTLKKATLKVHASSIRVIKYLKLQPKHHEQHGEEVIIFSGGGRSEIIASVLEFQGENTVWRKKGSVVLQNEKRSSYNSSYNPDMRVMDIHIGKVKESNLENGEKVLEYLLVCACSDGTMRLVSFHSFRNRFALLANFNLSNNKSSISHSISQIHSTGDGTFCSNSIGDVIIYSGNLLNKNYSFDYRFHNPAGNKIEELENNNFIHSSSIFRKQTNKSAITAMRIVNVFYNDSENNKSTNSLIVTGSDDGILKVSLACFIGNNGTLLDNNKKKEEDNKLCIVPLYEDCKLHSAAINSICIYRNRIFAVSADQVVSYRNLVTGDNVQSFLCGVSDVQGMTVEEDSSSKNSIYMVLSGQGLEIRKIIIS